MPLIFVLFLCECISVQQFCFLIYLLTFVLILSSIIMLSVYCLVADFLIIIMPMVLRQADNQRNTSTTSDMATDTD